MADEEPVRQPTALIEYWSMSLASNTPRLYELRAGPFVQGELRVLKFKGREALSKLFAFEIMFDSELPPWELEAGLVGQAATLIMQVPSHPPRVVHGVASWLRVENGWAAEHKHRQYRLRLVPSAWTLSKRVNTRIFQDQAASDVITTLMREAGLAVRFDLSTPLAQRAYCVQYHETDLAFIMRLLAEAGCYFYFEPPSDILDQLGLGAAGAALGAVVGAAAGAAAGATGLVETLVVSDQASFYPAIASSGASNIIERGAGAIGNAVASNLAAAAPTLVHRDPKGLLHDGERSVTRIGVRRAVRSNAVMLRDYLYQRPLFDARDQASSLGQAGLAAGAEAIGTAALNDAGSALRGGQGGSVGGAASDMLTSLPADLQPREVYRHQSDFFEPDAKSPSARHQLEQHRRRAMEAEGTSLCRRLSPGYKFALAEHEEPRMNREWVVTGVRHEAVTVEFGEAAGTASGERLVQYQNEFTCAPAELTMRPRRPARRLVQVADTAVVVGPDGQEVYTDAMGRIKVQFHWDRVGKKDEHSSCWIRVLHTWSGAGWGTQYIPRIGMEVLVLYHQGDPDKPVVIGCLPNASTPQPFQLPEDATRSGLRTNTLPTTGGHNELSFEDKKGSEQVFLRAERNHDEVVQNDHTVDVGRDEREAVHGSRTQTVDKDDTLTVTGIRSTAVSGDAKVSVGGQRVVAVKGDAVETIDGVEKRSIGGSAFLTAKGNYQMTINGAWDTVVGSHTRPADAYTAVWGESTHFASSVIRIQSEASVVIQCGESSITLTPTEVKIAGKNIVIDGQETTTIYGKKPVMSITDVFSLASDKITLTAQSSSLTLDPNATLLGAQVKLGSGSSASTQTRALDPAETKPLNVRLLDGQGQPYGGKKYDLMVGGQRFSGSTDGDGNVNETVPKAAKIGDLTLWLGQAPTGQNIRWQVHIEDQLEPAPASMGLMTRLRNLGFHMGDIDEDDSEARRIALQAFQLTHPEVPKDGDIAGNTLDLLTKRHGF
jgi:type VI secretion system secreted protein VgrG